MLNRKNLITVLLVLALIAVLWASINRTQHGDKNEWMKKHGAIAKRSPNPDKNCVKCHTDKRGETKENYCNECHSINTRHKEQSKWKQEHGTVAAGLSKNIGKFCLDCHGKTREEVVKNFCNECHQARNVKLINYQQK